MVAKLGAIRTATAAIGSLKVFEPTVTPPTIGRRRVPADPVPRPAVDASSWRVRVFTTAGATVATYQGSGAVVDATWDGSVIGGGGLPRADLLRWRIEAGRRVRRRADSTAASAAAVARIGPTATASLASVAAAPAVLINGVAGRITGAS